MRIRNVLIFSACAITLLGIQGCNEANNSGPRLRVVADCPLNPASINGTGATFPEPIYQLWITQYQLACPNQKVAYEGTGSGKGVDATVAMTTTFGASDGGFPDDALQNNPNLVMLPVTGGSIAVAYNLIQAPDLKLSRDVLVEIFSGSITNWNDQKIQKDNPHYTLPDLPITVVVRRDSSGSTETFSRYLSANKFWKERYGVNKEINFPQQAIRADGGSALGEKLSQQNGSIGYLETGKARTIGLSVAAVENRENQFVLPSTEAVQTALGSIELDENLGGHDGNPAGKNAYPIVNYTWLLFTKETAQRSPDDAEAFRKFVQYTLTPVAQETGVPLGYVPLTPEVNRRVSNALNSLN